jgi:oligo-1,6-glucosidase
LHRGTPYIYQGEELGMTNFPFASIEDFRDIESLNYYRHANELGLDKAQVLASLRQMSRDNGRTPMQWDGSPNAGFTIGTPWLAVNPNYQEINAAAQIGDPKSVFSYYQRLIALRHDLRVVAYGDFTMVLPDDEQIYAFIRRLEDVELLVLANFSDDSVAADLPDAQQWAEAELVLSNYPEDADVTSGQVILRAWEARVCRSAVLAPAGVEDRLN